MVLICVNGFGTSLEACSIFQWPHSWKENEPFSLISHQLAMAPQVRVHRQAPVINPMDFSIDLVFCRQEQELLWLPVWTSQVLARGQLFIYLLLSFRFLLFPPFLWCFCLSKSPFLFLISLSKTTTVKPGLWHIPTIPLLRMLMQGDNSGTL